MKRLVVPAKIKSMIRQGALVAINHSSGKDSQAMTILLRKIIPPDRIIIVHATLGRIEWPGTIEHIRATTAPFPLILAEAKTNFFTMVRRRKRFPTPAIRQCTSDLKRGPIERELRRFLKANPRFQGRIISCIGLRAEESKDRAKREGIEANKRQSIAGRTWINWHPILDMTEDEVYKTIHEAGEEPHWAYTAGMTRLSCSFCIMSCRQNLRTAAKLRPDLLEEYASLEKEVGHTLSPSRLPLSKIVA